jgi:purine-nucleoside phosphorylase
LIFNIQYLDLQSSIFNIQYSIFNLQSSIFNLQSFMINLIRETIRFIRKETDFEPEFGLILGTGLGQLGEQIEREHRIKYSEIPNFPVSTVASHRGELIFGTLSGKKVVAMSGRFHYYEGWDMEQVTFPVRVMKFLGIHTLLISNASGGLQAHIKTGDLVIIRDHINLQPDNPLRGENYEELGPRFPDMLHAYDRDLIEQGLAIATELGYTSHTGVYVGVSGPTLETPAEYRYMHLIGGDCVGMSTVPEVIVARHMGLKVFVISVCTDMGYPTEAITETTLEDVIRVANEAEPKVANIIKKLLERQ